MISTVHLTKYLKALHSGTRSGYVLTLNSWLTIWLDVVICTCCCQCISSLWSTIITEGSVFIVLMSPTLATWGVHLQQQASSFPGNDHHVCSLPLSLSLSLSLSQTNRYRSNNQCCHLFPTLHSSLPSPNTVQCSRAVWSKTSRWDTLLTRVARMMHMLELLRNTGRRRTCLRGCVSEREVECSNLMWKLIYCFCLPIECIHFLLCPDANIASIFISYFVNRALTRLWINCLCWSAKVYLYLELWACLSDSFLFFFNFYAICQVHSFEVAGGQSS